MGWLVSADYMVTAGNKYMYAGFNDGIWIYMRSIFMSVLIVCFWGRSMRVQSSFFVVFSLLFWCYVSLSGKNHPPVILKESFLPFIWHYLRGCAGWTPVQRYLQARGDIGQGVVSVLLVLRAGSPKQALVFVFHMASCFSHCCCQLH